MLNRRRPPTKRQFTWRQLAFEVFVVVLGVTLALGANELRQRFADKREMRVALESIGQEMQYNCERFTRAQTYHERILAEIDSVRTVNPDALERPDYVEALPSFRGYSPAFVTTAAYETARATGAIGLMPYGQALGLGLYYTFVDLYQATVRQALGIVMQTGEPTVQQVEMVVQITSEFQRELAPQSCEGARRLSGEPTESASDSSASGS